MPESREAKTARNRRNSSYRKARHRRRKFTHALRNGNNTWCGFDAELGSYPTVDRWGEVTCQECLLAYVVARHESE